MMKHNELLEFGSFRVDLRSRMLLRDAEPIPVPSRAFDTLVVLIERAGEDVSKAELMDAVWGGTFVEENNLNQAISTLRRLLGERRGDHRFIVTLPGRGYRFVAPVQRSGVDPEYTADTERSSTVRTGAVVRAFVRLPVWTQPLALLCLGLCFAGAALALVVWINGARGSGLRFDDARPSVAVVPFAVGDGSGIEYLGPGIAETLVARLGGSGQVVARRYDPRAGLDPGRICESSGADCVLDGEVRREGGRIRISARLVRTVDGATLWAGSFERPEAEIFDIEDAVTGQVARALVVTVDEGAAERFARRYTSDPVAYDAYLRGRYFWNRRTEDGFAKAIASYQQAIDRDPGYALAHAGIADAEVLRGLECVDAAGRSAALGRARSAALRAIALDGTLAEAHTSLGAVREVYERDSAEAEYEYRLAIALNPSYATAHQWLGELLEAEGRFGEASVALETARSIDPLSLPVNAALGECLSNMARYDDAIAVFERTLELEPSFDRARYGLGVALEQKQQYDGAIAEFRRIRETDAGNTRAIAALAHAYAAAGRREETLRLSAEFERLARIAERQSGAPAGGRHARVATTVEPLDRVILCLGLGDREAAEHWMMKATERHAGNLLRLSFDPRLAPLRG